MYMYIHLDTFTYISIYVVILYVILYIKNNQHFYKKISGYIHRYTYYIYETYMYIYLYWASKAFSFFDRVGINKNDCNRLVDEEKFSNHTGA